MENAAGASGSLIEITVGGYAEHETHRGRTWFDLHWTGFGHCFLPCRWLLVLLPPVRFFRFPRLQVRPFLAPPLQLPLLLHLDVPVRLRLRHPILGLMVEFVGVLLVVVVVVVVMVVVVVRDRAREMEVPKNGWRTQLGCALSLP